MNALNFMVVTFAVAHVVSGYYGGYYGDNEENDQIVGGFKAKRGDYQFLAALLRDDEPFCGGSLITPNHVLTAAHCVDYIKQVDYGTVKVLLNTTTIRPADDGAIHRGVKKIVHHRNYNSATSVNDIAVVTLDSPVEGISVISLPRIGTTLSYAGLWGTIIGFGRTHKTLAEEESSGFGSNKLLESSVKVITNSQCSAMYVDTRISSSMLCAHADGTDTCQGDSGGPLIVHGTQVGIVSWGYGCADSRYAGVYTRLTFFYSWIKANTV
ncbi:trypsin alpha-3-like [Daphnia carinata]|uniref:trypsin alpha-3-like n=1 Tax=Daphnia carinata TaxID=120202 RepID=UPI00257D3DF7|nr:trypsin alpha-3-like [Daphnia carinata]